MVCALHPELSSESADGPNRGAKSPASERARQPKRSFLVWLTHELRTPLNAVLGYQELLLDGTYGTLSPEQRKALEHGQRAATHLQALVNDLLDLAKLQSGWVQPDWQDVDVHAFAGELVTILEPVARARGCGLTLAIDGPPRSLRTDPRKLRQVLWNLLANACNYGADKPVELRVTLAGRQVRFAVRDRGPGIPSDDRARIFDEFVQLEPDKGGTGLGLTIARALADVLGGRLEVDSTLGDGSCFTLELPLDPSRSLAA